MLADGTTEGLDRTGGHWLLCRDGRTGGGEARSPGRRPRGGRRGHGRAADMGGGLCFLEHDYFARHMTRDGVERRRETTIEVWGGRVDTRDTTGLSHPQNQRNMWYPQIVLSRLHDVRHPPVHRIASTSAGLRRPGGDVRGAHPITSAAPRPLTECATNRRHRRHLNPPTGPSEGGGGSREALKNKFTKISQMMTIFSPGLRPGPKGSEGNPGGCHRTYKEGVPIPSPTHGASLAEVKIACDDG